MVFTMCLYSLYGSDHSAVKIILCDCGALAPECAFLDAFHTALLADFSLS